jgi:hypothetical protein
MFSVKFEKMSPKPPFAFAKGGFSMGWKGIENWGTQWSAAPSRIDHTRCTLKYAFYGDFLYKNPALCGPLQTILHHWKTVERLCLVDPHSDSGDVLNKDGCTVCKGREIKS